jgi:hypothetical protein
LQALLTDSDGDSIYTTTLRFLEGNYQYKFFNAVSQENVPAACAQNGNRFFSIDTSNNQSISMQAVCFSSCSGCAAIISATDDLGTQLPSLEIFPNPIQNIATIKIINNNENYELKFFASDGKLLHRLSGKGDEIHQIEKYPLPSGLIFIAVELENGKTFYQKVIVQ